MNTLTRNVLPHGFHESDWGMPNTFVRPAWEWGNQRSKSLSAMGCMKMDAVETEDKFIVYCECPGIPKDNMVVHIENNMLTIKGHKEKMYPE